MSQILPSVSKQYLPLTKAVEQATGYRPHLSTILRWCTRGARGRILSSVMVGGRRMTTIEAVQAFIEVTDEPTRDLSIPKDRSIPVNKAVARLQKRTRSKP